LQKKGSQDQFQSIATGMIWAKLGVSSLQPDYPFKLSQVFVETANSWLLSSGFYQLGMILLQIFAKKLY
jgi:hypothetical protein